MVLSLIGRPVILLLQVCKFSVPAGMGTKLQYAINPLATASDYSFLVYQLSDCGYSLEIGPRKHLEGSALNHFNHSVDEMFDLQDIESIKKIMLMHEDIFKRQVRELHWLYDRQIELMCELKNEMIHNQGALTTKASKNFEFGIWHQAMRDIKSDLPVYGMHNDPRELSSSGSGDSPRMPKGFNLERIDEERPSTSVGGIEEEQKGFKSTSLLRNNDGHDDEIDVELTLSIGCSSSKKKLNSQVNHCRIELGSSDLGYNGGENSSSLTKRDKGEDKGDPNHAVSSSNATFNQNIARSNWIFRDLRLNRT